MSKHRIALIDGDVLVYSTGFASDAAAKSLYKQQHPEDELLINFDISVHHEPLNYTLHGTGELIGSLLRNSEADDYRIFVSHPVNYREIFYPPYKTNRDVSHKPHWYDEIKEYLFKRHPTEYSEQGDEADDALGIMQMAFADDKDVETIIVSIDKDLDMIPGLHYNFSKTRKANGIYRVDDPEGLQKFYTQIITGDTSDGIPGLYQKTGRKAKAQYLYPLEGMSDEGKMRDYVIDVFDGDIEHVDLMGQLLWIKRNGRWYKDRLNANEFVS